MRYYKFISPATGNILHLNIGNKSFVEFAIRTSTWMSFHISGEKKEKNKEKKIAAEQETQKEVTKCQ